MSRWSLRLQARPRGREYLFTYEPWLVVERHYLEGHMVGQFCGTEGDDVRANENVNFVYLGDLPGHSPTSCYLVLQTVRKGYPLSSVIKIRNTPPIATISVACSLNSRNAISVSWRSRRAAKQEVRRARPYCRKWILQRVDTKSWSGIVCFYERPEFYIWNRCSTQAKSKMWRWIAYQGVTPTIAKI